jgi:hypothetical protein
LFYFSLSRVGGEEKRSTGISVVVLSHNNEGAQLGSSYHGYFEQQRHLSFNKGTSENNMDILNHGFEINCSFNVYFQ